jgi:hypothetical protein
METLALANAKATERTANRSVRVNRIGSGANCQYIREHILESEAIGSASRRWHRSVDLGCGRRLANGGPTKCERPPAFNSRRVLIVGDDLAMGEGKKAANEGVCVVGRQVDLVSGTDKTFCQTISTRNLYAISKIRQIFAPCAFGHVAR